MSDVGSGQYAIHVTPPTYEVGQLKTMCLITDGRSGVIFPCVLVGKCTTYAYKRASEWRRETL